MDINWHKALAEKWRASAAQGRLPHAVMLLGPPGVGKRAAAAWMVAHKLGLEAGDLPVYPFKPPEHADLHWIKPPEDKHSILIDQVRALVADLVLTSYAGHGKAAVIEPANLMTINAANSLLKTLEEPAGDSLLILVADRTGKLPATIFSRCQRIDVRVPSEPVGLEWLDRLHPGGNWSEALRVVGNAPLAAIAAAEQLETSAAMTRDFKAVAAGQASPVEVAKNWAKIDPGFVLEWLSRQVQTTAKVATGAIRGRQGLAIGESVLQHMDSRNLFCYLDIINRLRGQPSGSYNVQLTLEGLLIDWATGLNNVNRSEGFLFQVNT